MTFAILIVGVLGQLSLTSDSNRPDGSMSNLVADHTRYDVGRDVLVATGHAVFTTDQMVVHADEISFDQKNARATARGNVLLVSGQVVALADEIDLNTETIDALVKNGIFYQKTGVSPERLRAAQNPWEAKRLGVTNLIMSGTHIQRLDEETQKYWVDDLSFTPCDCSADELNWRIDSSSGTVYLNQHAILYSPVFYLGSAPVLWFPFLDLPLTERRTGLLIPRVANTANGMFIETPVFVTLGQSYDWTVTPGYYFGARPRVKPGGETVEVGVKGARLANEFRYAPSTTTGGRVTLGLLRDERPIRDPTNMDKTRPGTQRGLRGDLTLQHWQELGNGLFDRANVTLASDGYYVRDLSNEIIERENQYLRSTAAVGHRSDESYAGAEVTIRQELGIRPNLPRFGYGLFGNDRDENGNPLRGPNTLHRLPALTFALPERPLLGPVWGGVRADYVRISPWAGSTGDEGTDGEFNPMLPDPDGSQGNRLFEPGEREPRSHLDFNPRLSGRLQGGRYVVAAPYLAYRQDLWMGEVTGKTSHRAYPYAGTVVGTELSRVFSFGREALRHAVAPQVEIRYAPVVFRRGDLTRYDEIDTAVPTQGFTHLVAKVGQRFDWRNSAGTRELLKVVVGQGLDAQERRLADTFLQSSTVVGPVSADALVRYDPIFRRIAQFSTSLTASNATGDSLFVNFDDLRERGADSWRRGVDTLVGPTAYTVEERAQQIVPGATVRTRFGLGARYQIYLQTRSLTPVQAQLFALSYGPACDCWRLEAAANFYGQEVKVPNVFLNLTLARFGTFGGSG